MADPFIKAAQSITKQMLSSPTISTAWQYWFNAIGKLIGEKIDTLVGASGKVAVVSDQGGIKSGEVEIPVGATGYLVDDTTVQTVSNKTLSGTTITDLTLIQHDHGSTAKGGAIIDGDLTKKGAVQLSNSYAGTLQTKATTEKALSDGLAHVTQLVDTNANVTVKSVDNTAGSGDYLTVKTGTTALPVVLLSGGGSDPSVGLLLAAQGDAQYVQFWGGSGQYKGARFAGFGRDHANEGKAYLDFGGYDSKGQIIFRHRLTSSFLTVFTLNYDGKLTLVEDVDTAAGKRYLVNGAQHQHAVVDVTDSNLNCFSRLATITGLDAKVVAITEIYAVPAGKSMVVTGVVIRVTAFTAGSKSVQAVASFGGNSATYDDFLNSVTYTVTASGKAIRDSVLDSEIPVYAAGASFRVSIETGSNATTETWAVDLFGYLV